MSEPLVDPVLCSVEELREIIETDPTASEAYQRELNRRERMQFEIDHYEDMYYD
jgi:hypothetical protein